MAQKLVVTRDVTPDEVEWLQRTYKKGDEIWEFTGATYGCIDSSKGMACSDVEGAGPFFEFPLDALDYARSNDIDEIVKRVKKRLDFISPSIWTDLPMLISTIVHFTIEETKGAND